MSPAATSGPVSRIRRRWVRGGRRAVVAAGAVALVTVALSACQPPVLQLTVDTAADAPDATPGDGVCQASGGGGGCTLRAAIGEANATPGFDRITIAPGIDPVLSVAGTGEDADATGDLDSTGDLLVVGGGATVDAAGLDRVFDVVTGSLTLRDLTVTGGDLPTAERGSGLRSRADLTLERVTVTGNLREAISSDGTSLRVRDSAITGNGTGPLQAALIVSSGTAELTRTFLDDDVRGAYVYGASSLTLLDSTVHTGGAGLDFTDSSTGLVLRSTLQTTASEWGNFLVSGSAPGGVTVAGSILDAPAADVSFDACWGTAVASAGYNVVVADDCGFGGPGDLENASPLLGPLADNGGPTDTFLPHAGSPALDRIPAGELACGLVPLDQRGSPRPVGAACDAGAVEGVGPAVSAEALTVTSADDGVDATPGDGTCATANGACTLRAAVMETNATNPHLPNLVDTITIAPGIDPVLGLAGPGEDGAATGDLDVTGGLTVVGNGTTVDGAGLDRIFDSTAPNLSLSGATLTGGQVTGDGGAVRSTLGAVTLTDTTLHANHATGAGGAVSSVRLTGDHLTVTANTAGTDGGGLSTTFAYLTATTLDGNQAGGAGGGANVGQWGSVQRSTISANSAAQGGGLAVPNGNSLEVTASTISGNQAATDSAVQATGLFGPGLVLTASTVADNTGSPAFTTTYGFCTRGCYSWDAVVATGSILLGGGGQTACNGVLGTGSSANVAPDASCGTTLAGTGALGPLADNGGPTLTRLPLAGSGAVDAVPTGTAGLCDGSVPTDQRGVARPTGAACDVGAVEQ